ncbi:putative 2OG-Fe(II) oxygenase [Saccharospirillum mangrovi]|uniref:putative 2OG-Fe(II) oxygenase n=1 Tax=Saccharospirillum mangrovi TaxID=2161747 RepID=UPI000D346270|nr:putative 2OG-Fe(II) oxygenase [Saccharospirillum mangrovi]
MTDSLITDAATIEHWPTWTTDLFIATQPIHELIKAPVLHAIHAHRRQAQTAIASEVAVTAKHGLFESELDYLDGANADLQTLKQVLTDLVLDCATSVNQAHWPDDAEPQAEIIESWYHLTENGGYHDAHSHPNCSWCGIYCLEPGESNIETRNGVNRFYDPRHNAAHYMDAGTAYLDNHGFWDVAPVAGQVVIFPSYLKHSALPYFGQQQRVVLAFNAQVHLF